MAIFNFDEEISRAGSASFKYDGRKDIFGTEHVIPLWVADMDFAAPEIVRSSLLERADHPIYGYTVYPESLFESLIVWMRRRFGWEIKREWIVMCPGVVPSLHAAILAYTKPGDAIIVQPPVYPPFFSSIALTGRRLLPNPLRSEEGLYTFDLEHLERCIVEGARLLLLCSPHNPVGRVWNADELDALLKLCRRYGVAILSDEIHADLIYPGGRHTPLAKIAGNSPEILTAVAPSKTFNIPGLGLSAMIVSDAKRRAALSEAFGLLHVSATNPFSITAFEAAYRGGEQWLDELLIYLAGTRDHVRKFMDEHLPDIKLIESQGTYLLWLDCRGMRMTDSELKHFFVQQAGVGLSPGALFGEQGRCFMRMNIGAPRRVIMSALDNIARAYRLKAAAVTDNPVSGNAC